MGTSIVVALTLAANLAAPLALLAWLAFGRMANRLTAAFAALLTGAYLILIWQVGPIWHWVGDFWPVIFGLLYLVSLALLARHARKLRWVPERRPLQIVNLTVCIAVSVVIGAQLLPLMRAHEYPDPAVSLQFPLRDGLYETIQGGSSAEINHHYAIPAQRYAVDIVKVGRWGLRADGLLPRKLEHYAIFGEPVTAPCNGEVIDVENDVPDNIPPQTNPAQAAGNYVTLFCQGDTVLLAHLMRGSVAVRPGDAVNTGDLLGRVGNSGNSTEPHLHIHASAGRVDDHAILITGATGVPMLFGGRYLVRHDRVDT